MMNSPRSDNASSGAHRPQSEDWASAVVLNNGREHVCAFSLVIVLSFRLLELTCGSEIFVVVHYNLFRGVDPESHSISADRQDDDRDVITNDELFCCFAGYD